ncbi:hypothetical protein SAMN02745221_02120 [Thermosyntropha lipolytica DSM 11003]|uniref:DUF503 domain-containing protein n=1 Tax=Thermosyntropha lipolytica DSM 11003 TaxID=1123382 RepID=A0A1M5RWF4_9FIRM|nr:DUF503 domain-containing protein [Thermosyntropha lipolytica]SHH30509.1 hypothetical protein SAMN02745221_02120 [Thermosyntropha lipolytica DSM 11003]
MYIVYGKIELFLPYCGSLKEKRKVVNSIVDRVRKRFNISIAEAGYHDLWQRTVLGFAAVADGEKKAEMVASVIQETVEGSDDPLEIIAWDVEIVPYHD